MSDNEPVILRFWAAAPDRGTFEAREEIRGGNICSECFTVYGNLEVRGFLSPRTYEQRCACERGDVSEERWLAVPGNPNVRFDFNKYVELCYCCGAVALKSGSRWCVWFCENCKQRVLDLNTRLGFYLIPIGRHSLMNRIRLDAAAAQEPETVARFATGLKSFFDRIKELDEWSRSVVRNNATALGFPAGSEIGLARYLALAQERIDKQAALEQLAAQFLKGSTNGRA